MHPSPCFKLLAGLGLLAGMASAEWRTGEWNGRQIRYQVIDGDAVWNGDIVLGPVAEFEQELHSKQPGKFSSVLQGARYRWTNNTVPYTINADIPQQDRISTAVANWNNTTNIKLVPRSGEANYVVFRRRNGFACSSSVGMMGGQQFVNIPDDCEALSVTHEIGHVLGLFHTQSRDDRDMFVNVRYAGMDKQSYAQYDQNIGIAADVGAYSYESIMHYNVTGFAFPGDAAMQTLPSGIPVGQRTALAATDIDTVIRIYGGTVTKTTVASNPPGATILVDGQTVTAPAGFDWSPGSRHTLSVEEQTINGSVTRFGRWSDFGLQTHEIVASPDVTVYTAQLRRFYPLETGSNVAGGGSVSVEPASDDQLYPEGTLMSVTPLAKQGYTFTNWFGFGFFSAHGSARVPARFPLTEMGLQYGSNFTISPNVTTVTTQPEGLHIQVDGTSYTAPRSFVWTPGTTHTVNIAETTQVQGNGAYRYLYREWSDGNSPSHSVTAAAGIQKLTAAFDTQYRVILSASPSAGGSISSSPAPVNDYLPAGTVLNLQALNNPGYQFNEWRGDASSKQGQIEITVNDEMDIRARFDAPSALTAAGATNAASFGLGALAPGELLTFFGLNIGPAEAAGLRFNVQGTVDTSLGGTRVLFDGRPAPMIYVSANQISVAVPFGVSNSTLVQLERNGTVVSSVRLGVAAAAPAFFTANSSGKGNGAILNQDGGYNTPSTPAAAGSIVVLYATGAGAMSPAAQDGSLAQPPYARIAAPVKVFIADREAEIEYSGAAPQLINGVVQINVRVPAGIAPGSVPLVLEIGGVRSPRTVSLAVQ